jgi:hypothetical protein
MNARSGLRLARRDPMLLCMRIPVCLALWLVASLLPACESPAELEPEQGAEMADVGRAEAWPANVRWTGAWDVAVVESSPACDAAPIPVQVVLSARAEAAVTYAVGGQLEEASGWWMTSTVGGLYLESSPDGGWYNDPGSILRPAQGGCLSGTWTVGRYASADDEPCVMSVVLTRM